MSDENNNYDDFMMSDDDAMESFEMEEDSDNEVNIENINDRSKVNHDDIIPKINDKIYHNCSTPSITVNIKELYEVGIVLKDNCQFEEAKKVFGEIIKIGCDKWIHKCNRELILCWHDELIKFNCDNKSELVTGLKNYMNVLNSFVNKNEYGVVESLKDIIIKIVPGIDSSFLFETSSVVDVNVIKFQMEILNCLDSLQVNSLLVRNLLDGKKLENQIWHEKLTNNFIPKYLLKELSFFDSLEIDILLLKLQSYFLVLFQTGSFNEENMNNCINILEKSIGKSIYLLQQPRTMSLLHFGKCLLYMNQKHYWDYDDNIFRCKHHFWECFKDLEELGLTNLYAKDDFFKHLSLSGFILCDMILLNKSQSTKIIPFELEQIKIMKESTLVDTLKQIYESFQDMDLKKLSLSIKNIEQFQLILFPLIDKIYELARIGKIWKQIARFYQCISIEDILKLLKIDETNKITRDELLTILMKSLINHTEQISFKLDFKNNCVYFGDQHENDFTSINKEMFLSMQISNINRQHSKKRFHRNDDCIIPLLNENPELLRAKEYADNISVFQSPIRSKQLTLTKFMDKIRNSRIQDYHTKIDIQQRNKLRYTDLCKISQYTQLLSIIKEYI